MPAGQNISWSVSDPSVATLDFSSNSQATINFIGSGSVVLQATIFNNCNQLDIRTFTMFGGLPTLTAFTCGPASRPFCDGGQIPTFSNELPTVNRGDRITATFGGMTAAEQASVANWQWQKINNNINLSSFRNSTLVASVFFGITGVEVRARNACGWSQWYPLTWEFVEIPNPLFRVNGTTDTSIKAYPNPSNNSWNFSTGSGIIQNIVIVDLLGKNISSSFFSENQATVDCSSFQKGIYFAKVKTSLGVETLKLVKN